MTKKLLSIFLVILFAACGYSFQGSQSVLPKNIKKIYLADIENQTTEINFGRLLNEAMHDRFSRYDAVEIVDSEDEADAVLTTKLLSIDRQSRSVTADTDTALQLETSVQVAGDLKTTNGLLLWNNPSIHISKLYGTADSAVVTSSANFQSSGLNASDLSNLNSREIARGQEQQVFEDMAETIAKQIYTAAILPEF